ncbi:MAG: putative oxidoreductase C-terminal domain-containing protein [Alphaproteobacteria bacterium]
MSVQGTDGKHRLVIPAPGHFHAALAMRRRHPRLDDTVHVYAPEGPEVRAFLALVESFNTRAEAPTRWRLVTYVGPDWLARATAEKAGDIAIVAGRNAGKAALIRRLHEAGFAVLADKPMLTDAVELPHLETVFAGPPPLIELMADRHAPSGRVLAAISGAPEVFGQWRREDGQPAIELKSTHHLYKVVNGAPLVRPPWYFDVDVQGEGIMDVTTHMVDKAQGLAPGALELISARQWPTQVPRDVFAAVTGLADFPPELAPHVEADELALLCNAAIAFTAGGVPVDLEALWGLREAPGGDDSSYATLRGTRATARVVSGPETGGETRISLHAVADEAIDPSALAVALGDLAHAIPVADGYRIEIAAAARSGSEEHFFMVLEQFLDALDNGAALSGEAERCLAKYRLLTAAKALSHRDA